MTWSHENIERLVIKWIIERDLEEITQMNFKDWFWQPEAKALAWACFFSRKAGDTNPLNHIDWSKTKCKESHIKHFLEIDLLCDEDMKKCLDYFKHERMWMELYEKSSFRSNDKVREIMQLVGEKLKAGPFRTNEKAYLIIYKFYEKEFNNKMGNKLKQENQIKQIQLNKNKHFKKWK